MATVGSLGGRATRSPWWRFDPRQLSQARELTVNLVRRDLKVRHRGSFLGMLWSLTTPLLTVALYYCIFKYILRAAPNTDARSDGNVVPFAVYFFCGLTLWNLFSSSVGNATNCVVGSAYLLQKVYFPRAILPLSVVGSSLVTFGFELAILLAVTFIVVGLPTVSILWLVPIVVVTLMLSYGFALFLSAVTVFLRDVAHFIGIVLMVWFWGTPIIYSLGYVSGHPLVTRLLELNPMTGVIVGFRNVVVLGRPPDLGLLAYDFAFAAVMLAIGGFVFQRWQRLFPEMV